MKAPQRLRAADPREKSRTLPDTLDLDDDPQLGPIAVLQVALEMAARALESHHAYGGTLTDAVLDTPNSPVLLLTRLVVDRSYELTEVLKAYRVAIAQAAQDEDERDAPHNARAICPDDLPF